MKCKVLLLFVALNFIFRKYFDISLKGIRQKCVLPDGSNFLEADSGQLFHISKKSPDMINIILSPNGY